MMLMMTANITIIAATIVIIIIIAVYDTVRLQKL
jgi:hypothetical protein